MKNFVRPIIFISVIASSAFCAASLFAQISLTGRVMTFDSVNVQNAVVVLRSVSDTSVRYSTMTDAQGRFAFLLTKTEEEPRQPASVILHQNYPNPFTDFTTIRYELEKAAEVRLVIFDVLGCLVRRLASGRQTAGLHTETWDGKNETGEKLRPGVYFSALSTEKVKVTGKMLLGSEDEPHKNRNSFAFEKRFESGFQKSIFTSEYSIDVVDTTSSLPRFETRKGTSIVVTRDSSIVIYVHKHWDEPWTFISYLTTANPLYVSRLKVYDSYLYLVLAEGFGRMNIESGNRVWEVFPTKLIAGEQGMRTLPPNDYLILDRRHDSMMVAARSTQATDHTIHLSGDGGRTWAYSDTGLGWNYRTTIHSLLQFTNHTICAAGSPMYLSSDNGQLWKTTQNNGTYGEIHALNANRTEMLVAAGGYDPLFLGDLRLSVSHDKGESWFQPIAYWTDPYVVGNRVVSIVFSAFSDKMYISTAKDLIVSIDSGRTWLHRPYGTCGSGEILENPLRERHLFLQNLSGILYESIDDGVTWTKIEGPLRNSLSNANPVYSPKHRALFLYNKEGIWKYNL